MKQKINLPLIALSFVLSQLQIFLPFVTHKASLFGMLVINLALLLVINIVQRRPELKALDAEHDEYWDLQYSLRDFDVQAYFIANALTLLAAFGVIVGHYAFGLEREALYDVILLAAGSFVFALKGRNLSATFQ